MILAIDVGNTNITLGFYDESKLLLVSRIFTQRQKTSDEIATQLLEIFKLHGVSPKDISGAVISSVVPELSFSLASAVRTITNVEPIFVGGEHNGNLKVDVLQIEYLGADLICDCIGAIEKYPLPCLVIDMGTATKILAIDKDAYFVGCTISPGVKISLDALSSGTSLLPSISFSKPERVAGTNTVECMQSGCVYGNAAMLDGLTQRIAEELGFSNPSIVATGGYSKGIIPCCKTKITYDENLLLDGLKIIFDKADEQKD